MKNLKRIMAVLLLVFMVCGAVVSVMAAATPKTEICTAATMAYELKGLPYNRAVQNFYIASKYIYVTQRIGETTYLSRLTISGKKAYYKDHMTIKRAGHGQSLDMYTYNDINYLYLGCKSESSDNHFSLQIARIKYEAGKTYDYTDLNRLTHMNYATKSTKSLGTTYRVAAGGNSKYTIFRIQTTGGAVTFSIYDTVKLNKLLDNSKSVAMNTDAARACNVKHFTQTGKNIVRPNGSFQGIDMLGNSDIYVSGGLDGQTPQIARMSNNGAYEKLVYVSNVGKKEIEGLQCKNGNIYFLIIPNTVFKWNTQKIYYLSEALFEN
ncbi:MAG: hypothetical protein IJA60_00255 [Clostridia bacterium]|nr:hypothetical protein [Clostridia bacterium]